MKVGRGRRPGSSIRRAVVQFAAAGLVAALVIGVGIVYEVRRNATAEAIRQAHEVALIDGTEIVEPVLTDGVVRGDPSSLATLDRIVRERVLTGQVVRVKLWTEGGRILYSDEPRLIGQTFGLSPHERHALATNRVRADVSDLNDPESVFERSFHKLLEVYLPVHTPGGQRLLFEVYLRYHAVTTASQHLWASFAPVLLGGVLLLILVQVPLALALARRVRDARREREALLQRAIDASERERRRIAQDLHDGVVQELAGVSLSLAAAAEQAGQRGVAADSALLREAADHTRRAVRDLRTLIVDIAPPNLAHEGLDSALADLLAPFSARGVRTHLDLEAPLDVSPLTGGLVFRVAQEALRNAAAHAEASEVTVSLRAHDGWARLVVADDGRGFSPDELERRRQEGHVGIDLLTGWAHDAGGQLNVESSPGTGTRVELQVPRT